METNSENSISALKSALAEVRTPPSIKKSVPSEIRTLPSQENTGQRPEDQELDATPTVPEAGEPGYWRKNAATLREAASAVVLYFTAVWGAGLLAMALVALTMPAAHLTACGARRLRFNGPPWDWLWAMWHRWFWMSLSGVSATDPFSASLLSSAMAIVFIARCVSMVVIRQIPRVILLPLLWGSQLIMAFSKSSWLMWSVLLLLGCSMGIPAPTASAFTMKTSSMACLAILAVASATWANNAEMAREVMAARSATKYSACTVEIYNVPEIK